MKRSIQICAISALAAGIAACGGSGGGSSTGSVSVGLTDAPIDNAEAVNIEVEALVLQTAGGERLRYKMDFPQPLNLLELQGGAVEALIQDEEVPAGEYNWMRLELGDKNSIDIDTGAVIENFKLTTPSARGVQTSGFVVPAGGAVALTIDFDVRKSIVDPQNDNTFKLKPVIRLVDNSEVGTIEGTVSANLLNEQCGSISSLESAFLGNVYVYEGADEIPDDIGGANEPLVVVPVTNDGSESSYTASFIPAGDYTVSYSCGDDFVETADAEPADDDLTFVGQKNVKVVEGETAIANFDTQDSVVKDTVVEETVVEDTEVQLYEVTEEAPPAGFF